MTSPRRSLKAGSASLVRIVSLALFAVTAHCGGERAPAVRAPERPVVTYGPDGTPATPILPLAGKPSVVLICLDTVRADAFAPWAKGAPAMPETSAWMKQATVFLDAHAAAPWTAPSVASLLTGVLPSRHGARELENAQLVGSNVTLTEILFRAGFTCGAYAGSNFGWVSRGSGLLQGFDAEGTKRAFIAATPFSFATRAEALVANHRMLVGAGSQFLFLHTYEAHDPYGAPPAGLATPPPVHKYTPEELARLDLDAEADGGRALTRLFLLDAESRSSVFETAAGGARRQAIVKRWFEQAATRDPKGFASLAAEAKATYENGLRRLDRAVASYLNGADAAHVLDDAIVVLCADHGEGFGEHGTIHHGRRVYSELTHVALAIRAPKLPRGKVIEGTCSLLDVMQTVLDLCGLPESRESDGRSLVPLALGRETAGRIAISEERRTKEETGLEVNQTLAAVRDRTMTWIGTRERLTGVLTEEIFDRTTDPDEARPLPLEETLRRASADFRAAVEHQRRDGVR